MSFASILQEAASRLLSTYGQAITVTRYETSGYNTDTGEPYVQTSSTYAGYGNPQQYTVEELVENTVLYTDTKLYFYSTTTPAVGDVFTIDGVDLRSQNVISRKAQGENVLYIVQLREA